MTTKRLACPACGWDGSTDGKWEGWFQLVDPPVTLERRVEGFNARGALEVADEDAVAVEDDSAGHRLRCGDCRTEFPLPPGIEIERV